MSPTGAIKVVITRSGPGTDVPFVLGTFYLSIVIKHDPHQRL
jgi:hypothetical protein